MTNQQQELSKAFEATRVESKCTALWEQAKCFHANPHSSKPSYCIVIPPPNVTGRLHMGHALVNTLQDILIRYKRMDGYEALWVPGTDHAGISTQTVVERHLIATEHKRRIDYSREEFLKRVWHFKEENEGTILSQLKRLGASCDWQRLRFTMDEKNNQAVRTAFKRLFDKGLIYRGDYLVNWDPVTGTALADDEVEYEEQEGFLWHIEYPAAEGTGSLIVATTRPETLFGDVAVAVHPDDARYKDLLGKHVRLPLTERMIPVIADHRIDKEFGTGAVKVTPAHDPNDWQIGLTHNLEAINVMTFDGHMNERAGNFAGMRIADARKAVVEALKTQGNLKAAQPHSKRVGLSYRSKAVIEPMLSKQWFLKMSEFAPDLRRAVEEGGVELIPEQWRQTYFHWIDNLRDWCISRQLWWGHRIPIWYRKDNPEIMLCSEDERGPQEVQEAPEDWVRDEDVLDTWFSSALWPFAALGWPEKTPELQAFYPNSVLVTGHDILFFWVARMMLMSHLLNEKWPFPQVFLHGLIYAKSYWRQQVGGGIAYCIGEERRSYETGATLPKEVQFKWEKMSKSKGNVIDPIEMIDTYGTDAVRMTLCALATQNRQIDLDERRFEEYKNFANKIWNASRFVLMNIQDIEGSGFSHALGFEDLWILQRLATVTKEVRSAIDTYHFDRYATSLYRFFWDEFCSYYLELAKPALMGKLGQQAKTNKQWMIVVLLMQALRLLHPVAPFITEELFATLKARFSDLQPSGCPYFSDFSAAIGSECCAKAPFPKELALPSETQNGCDLFRQLQEVVHAMRHLRSELKIATQEPLQAYLIGEKNLLESLEPRVMALVRCKSLHLVQQEPENCKAGKLLAGAIKVWVMVPEVPTAQKEKMRQKFVEAIARLKVQLGNKEFIERAPPHVVEQLQKQLEQQERTLAEIDNG